MRRIDVIASLLILGTLALAARADELGRRYTIDPKAGEISLFVKKKGALKAFAHDHDIVARVYTGAVVWAPPRGEGSSVELAIDTNELIVRDAELSQDDRDAVQKHLRADDVLDVQRFPKITFTSQSVVAHAKDASGRTPLSVVGKLTLHGVTRQARIEVLLEEKPDELVVTGEHVLLQSDHGIEPYSAAFGAIAVADPVTLKFRIVARRDAAEKSDR